MFVSFLTSKGEQGMSTILYITDEHEEKYFVTMHVINTYGIELYNLCVCDNRADADKIVDALEHRLDCYN